MAGSASIAAGRGGHQLLENVPMKHASQVGVACHVYQICHVVGSLSINATQHGIIGTLTQQLYVDVIPHTQQRLLHSLYIASTSTASATTYVTVTYFYLNLAIFTRYFLFIITDIPQKVT